MGFFSFIPYYATVQYGMGPLESGAILMYLAEKTGKFMSKDMRKKYDEIQWLFIQVANVGPAFGNFTHFNLFT